MRLIRLDLQNFKKIPSIFIKPDGKDLWIFGKNGTGKTTIADAFYWILANKTSNDKRCDDDIKLKDKNGNAVMDGGIEHRVDMMLKLDTGKQITLSKVLAEKWVKSNGTAQKEYTGNTTTHYIDGVKKSQKDYNAFIEQNIGDISKIKMSSLTSYFNSMPWKKQREVLTSMCGDVSESDVIDTSDELKELQSYLDGKSVNDFIVMLTESKKQIREQLEVLPARIDEATKSLPDVSGLAKDALEVELKNSIYEQNKARDDIAALQNGSVLSELKSKAAALTTAMEQIKQDYDLADSQKAIDDVKNVGELDNKKQKIMYEIEQNRSKIVDNNTKIKKIDVDLVKARADYKSIYADSFGDKTTCPTCGQELPADMIAAAKQKFNLDKSSKLEQARTTGKQLAAKKIALDNLIKKLSDDIANANKQIKIIDTDINNIKAKSDNVKQADDDNSYLKDIKYQELSKQYTEISKKTISVQEDNLGAITNIRSVIAQLDLDIAERQKKLLLFEQRDNGNKRIDELKNQQKDLVTEYGKIDYKLNLTQIFIKKQIEMLDSKINSKFKLARFKLFDKQINGTIVPCCEAITKDGATYGTTMSTGEQLKIGLDICTILAKHFNLNVPIFIDNAEGVTDLPDTDAQQIRLVVSQIDDKLRVTEPIVKQNKDVA